MDAVLNRAGRRDAERRARRTRRVGATLTAGAAALGASAAVVASTASTAGALTSYEVQNNNDSGPGSLRQAMIDAEADGDDSQITFAANVTGVINLLEDLEIDGDGNLTVIGPGSGALTLDGGDNDRIFYMDGSWQGDLATISGLTLTNGTAADGGAIKFYDCGDCSLVLDGLVISDNVATGDGGGGIEMYSAGDLTIRNTVISGNTAGGGGGGIQFYNSGDLVISSSTVSGNRASSWAGGLYFYNADSLTILASTFADNHALAGGGGAMWVGGEPGRPGPVLIANSTFTGNTATQDGGALALYQGDVQILQSTISGNTAGDVGDGLYLAADADGLGLEASGHNVDGEVPATKGDGTPKDPKEPRSPGVGAQDVDEPVVITGSIISANAEEDIGTNGDVDVTSTSNLIGTWTEGVHLTSTDTIVSSAPGLAPLASNGGPTQTMALLALSPAENAGPAIVPDFPGNSTDQRGAGFARVQAGRVDIGAYEVQLVVTFTG